MASKIPFSRFDKDSPATYEMSAEGLIREEIKFEKFVNRLRSTFQEILVKPLYIQMCLKFPHLKDDVNFKTNISLVFNADNMFAELKEMEIFQKRIDFISSMKDSITTQDKDMNDVPYFDLQFLVERFLKMDPADLERNKEMLDKKEADKKKKEKEGGDESAGGVDLGF